MKKSSALLTALVFSVSLAGCAADGVATNTFSESSVQSQVERSETTNGNTETTVSETTTAALTTESKPPSETTTVSAVSETVAETKLFDGKVYDINSKYFLEVIPLEIKVASYKAARAWLRGDSEEFVEYVFEPEKFDEWRDYYNTITK